MDRNRSPRRYHNAGGQVSYYPPLSDEARLLQRLEEVELPPGATDAERVAARAEAAAGVEQAANEVGEHWARAYQELHPDWQPTLTDNELTAARAELAAAPAPPGAGESAPRRTGCGGSGCGPWLESAIAPSA